MYLPFTTCCPYLPKQLRLCTTGAEGSSLSISDPCGAVGAVLPCSNPACPGPAALPAPLAGRAGCSAPAMASSARRFFARPRRAALTPGGCAHVCVGVVGRRRLTLPLQFPKEKGP